MITYTDQSQIERRTKVAKYASLGGLGIMLPGLVIALGGLANPSFTAPEYVALSYVSLIVGTVVATIGGRMAERWLMEPRDDQLSQLLHTGGSRFADADGALRDRGQG
ncbi:MAG: hypothetical protein E6J26_07220 [Chloroflexi bacterium]|nr:MAG: hypothetical protein E6J26_07220 [Chloroflexota bacterium]